MPYINPTYPVNLQSSFNRSKQMWFRGMPDSTGPKDLIRDASFRWQGSLKWGGASHAGASRAVVFDGATGSMCSTVVKPPVTGKGLTMGIWFKTTAAYTAGAHGLLGWNNSADGTSGTYDRTLYLGTAGTLTQRPVFFAGSDLIADIVLNDGYWHFVVGTIAANDTATIYVDGKSYGTSAFSLYDGWTAPSLCVGRTAGSARGSNLFTGSMDDWFYADREYSNGEVCALYHALRKNDRDLWNWLGQPVLQATAGSSFKPAWIRQQSRIIGGGVT